MFYSQGKSTHSQLQLYFASNDSPRYAARNAPGLHWRAENEHYLKRLYILHPNFPEKTALYVLELQDNLGTYDYQTDLELVTENYVFHLDAHYDDKTSAWVANVQYVDPDILVKSAKQVYVAGNPPTSQNATTAWEITNNAVANTKVRVLDSKEVAVSGNFVLGGNYSLTPIDPQTGQALSSANLDKIWL